MSPLPTIRLFRTVALASACLSVAVVLCAQPRNPFLPPGATTRPAAPAIRPAPPPPSPKPVNANLELRGIFHLGDKWYFNLHDKVKDEGWWVTKGETVDGIEIESWEEDGEKVRIKGGMVLTLKESSSKVLPVPSMAKSKPTPVRKPTTTTVRRPTPPRPTGSTKSSVTIPPRRPRTPVLPKPPTVPPKSSNAPRFPRPSR